jgi:hypothetical protein
MKVVRACAFFAAPVVCCSCGAEARECAAAARGGGGRAPCLRLGAWLGPRTSTRMHAASCCPRTCRAPATPSLFGRREPRECLPKLNFTNGNGQWQPTPSTVAISPATTHCAVSAMNDE